MKKGPVYLNLSLGSSEPRVASTDDQSGGPVFGPYRAICFSDHDVIYMEKDSGTDILRTSGRGVYYDGAHYPEWSARSVPESKITAYDRARIEPPRSARSDMTIEERFRTLALLFESAIEERLSILREDNPDMREFILTSDIEDQIAHWQAVQKKVMDLK